MSIALNKKVGEMDYDGLISDLTPPVEVRSRTIAKQATETAYTRLTERVYISPDCTAVDLELLSQFRSCGFIRLE